MDREKCCDYPPSYKTAIADQQELTTLEGSSATALIMAPPLGYYTAVMQLPATLVADHDGDEEYSTSTSEEIEVDIEVFKKLSSGHTHCVDDTIGSLSSTTD